MGIPTERSLFTLCADMERLTGVMHSVAFDSDGAKAKMVRYNPATGRCDSDVSPMMASRAHLVRWCEAWTAGFLECIRQRSQSAREVPEKKKP